MKFYLKSLLVTLGIVILIAICAEFAYGYTVLPGDTLQTIGTKLGVDWHELTGYSSGNPDLLYVGEEVRVAEDNMLFGAAPTSTIIKYLILDPSGGGGTFCLHRLPNGLTATTTADCGTGSGGGTNFATGTAQQIVVFNGTNIGIGYPSLTFETSTLVIGGSASSTITGDGTPTIIGADLQMANGNFHVIGGNTVQFESVAGLEDWVGISSLASSSLGFYFEDGSATFDFSAVKNSPTWTWPNQSGIVCLVGVLCDGSGGGTGFFNATGTPTELLLFTSTNTGTSSAKLRYTTGTETLHVTGLTATSAVAFASTLNVLGATNLATASSSGNVTIGGTLQVVQTSTFQNDIRFGSGGGLSVIKKQSAFIGIATLTPGSPLTVFYNTDNNNTQLANFTNGADQDLVFTITAPGAGDKFALLAPSTNTSLDLGVNSTRVQRITSGGSILTGTFDVSGAINASSTATIQGALQTRASTTMQTYATCTLKTDGSGLVLCGTDNTSAGGGTVTTSTAFTSGTVQMSNGVTAITDTVVSQLNGNIGIGTTTPGYKLSIVGDGYIEGTQPYLDFYETDQATYAGIYQRSKELRLYTDATGEIRFDNNIDVQGVTFSPGIVPTLNDSYDLGSSAKAWAGLWLGPDECINFNGVECLIAESTFGSGQGAGDISHLILQGPSVSTGTHRVGIGIDPPLANLHVSGTTILAGSATTTGNHIVLGNLLDPNGNKYVTSTGVGGSGTISTSSQLVAGQWLVASAYNTVYSTTSVPLFLQQATASGTIIQVTTSTTGGISIGVAKQEQCLEPTVSLFNVTSTQSDYVIWSPRATSTITKLRSNNGAIGDVMNFNIIWADSRAQASSTSQHLFLTNTTSTATSTLDRFPALTAFASTTVNAEATVRIITGPSANSTEFSFTMCYIEQ